MAINKVNHRVLGAPSIAGWSHDDVGVLAGRRVRLRGSAVFPNFSPEPQDCSQFAKAVW
jgi:hypothetical protein